MIERLRRLYAGLISGEVVRHGTRRLYLMGRDGLKYSDGKRSVLIETEMLTGPVNRVIYAGLITHWLPPHEAEAISAAQRSEIAQMVRDYLVAQGRTVEVDWEPASGASGMVARRGVDSSAKPRTP
jgi:hypothetical protein